MFKECIYINSEGEEIRCVTRNPHKEHLTFNKDVIHRTRPNNIKVYEVHVAELIEERPNDNPMPWRNTVYVFKDSGLIEYQVGGILNPPEAKELSGYYEDAEEAIEAAELGQKLMVEYYRSVPSKW